ncbi:propanediol utilization protein [Planosporangium flavigriseum]|uniref:Glycerol dehydrogenase n=1 Tax=Planosporangium flavigriseum TaxID=373681 RepID=A0A8J3LXH1_9ACTN|nr:diol dehydratase small subunit [Planosporangium flavigriseum]NJC66148.1 propanediol utilization protein [Planosporangium flavigriseum]GIG75160.1 glycerol dehydrogenase [Planosporangium flavigriseum]
MTEQVRGYSGRPLDEVTVEALRAGSLGPDDVRIHPSALRAQAAVAANHGNPQLASALGRAAELARLPDADVLAAYEALRPGRSTADELEALARRLDEQGAPRTAAFVREAASWYATRGLLG